MMGDRFLAQRQKRGPVSEHRQAIERTVSVVGIVFGACRLILRSIVMLCSALGH